MGKLYREITGDMGEPTTAPHMRELLKQPGKTDQNGNIVYFTEQAHKDKCDINMIIAKYDKTGLINHISKIEAEFGDVTGIEFKDAQDLIQNSLSMFNELPSKIRNYFENSPEKLLTFMENSDNREKAIELGLIDKRWTPETDGLGEHVKEGENVITPPPVETPPPAEPAV